MSRGVHQVNIWAHRGCSYRYPENTLSAFAEALRYDITGIELDVQRSRDGRLVVMHDETVNRTTNGCGNVCDLTLAELKSLRVEANSESGLEYETVPTLREVLELVRERCLTQGLLINIELKNSEIAYEGMEAAVIEMVGEFGLGHRVVYSSFNPDSVALVKELDPQAMTAVLAVSGDECLALKERVRADAIHPFVKQVGDNVRTQAACPVRAWNVREFEPFFPSNDVVEVQDTAQLRAAGITDIFTNVPEQYVALLADLKPSRSVRFFSGRGVDAQTGLLSEADGCTVNWEPLEVHVGDVLRTDAPCRLDFYEADIADELVRTYTYHPESNWTAYRPEKSDGTLQLRDARIAHDGFVRLVFEGLSPDDAASAVHMEQATRPEPAWPQVFQDECDDISRRVAQVREPGDLVLAVLTDIHYEFGGLWDDTARNLRNLARRVPLDAVIQLGDLTDGLFPASLTEEVTGRVLADLRATGVEVYGCLGNHDANYFRGNPDRLDVTRQSKMCLGQTEPTRFVDYSDHRVRLIFLDSFDPLRKERYGFSRETVHWLKRTLKSVPRGWRVLVFSHVPPLARIHVWSDSILNGWRIISMLERFSKLHGGAVIAYIHGHNHADQVFLEHSFPIVSIGCAKYEDFSDHKPAGSTTPERQQGEASQELWDVLVVKPRLGSIDFFRFGAGEDRWVGPR